ncbi:hypothetical protein GCM10023196_045310 [Actinoallomurus vinaceus]|uniref:DUF2867 domain-containing protein n=1 Tax=Actinoallomurus vinaceus TaxID=1080074 RepID=A0ABP8UBV0_9ACTN
MEKILDRLIPTYDFRTRYSRRVAAPPEAVWEALQQVTADELPVTRLLMRIRSAGRAPLSGPIAQALPMADLGREEGREAVSGRVAKFWQFRPETGPEETADPAVFAAFSEPGWAKAAMSFQLSPTADGTLLAAETRVRATDRASRRAFAPYWLLIRAGGAGFIRLELLRAIARRAESATAS